MADAPDIQPEEVSEMCEPQTVAALSCPTGVSVLQCTRRTQTSSPPLSQASMLYFHLSPIKGVDQTANHN